MTEAVSASQGQPQGLDIQIESRHDVSSKGAVGDGGANKGAAEGGALQECRICLTADNQEDLVQPCSCTGSVRYAHMACLKAWCVENLSLKCEICGSVYKAEVVEALMSTLVEAQDRQLQLQQSALLAQLQHIHVVATPVGVGSSSGRASGQSGAVGPRRVVVTSGASPVEMQAFVRDLVGFHAAYTERRTLAREQAEILRRELGARRRRFMALYAALTVALVLYLLLMVTYSPDEGRVGMRIVLFLVPVLVFCVLLNAVRRRSFAATEAVRQAAEHRIEGDAGLGPWAASQDGHGPAMGGATVR